MCCKRQSEKVKQRKGDRETESGIKRARDREREGEREKERDRESVTFKAFLVKERGFAGHSQNMVHEAPVHLSHFSLKYLVL